MAAAPAAALHRHRRNPPLPPPSPSPSPLPPPPPAAPPPCQMLPVFVPALFLLLFFLAASFSIYLLGDLFDRFLGPGGGGGGGRPRRRREKGGLHPAVVASFKIVSYDERWTGVTECAVCLAEFGGGDAIRLMPECGHIFHPGCVDTWLAASTTCPVCRLDLSKPPAVLVAVDGGGSGGGEGQPAIRFEAREGEQSNR